jgi:hypothetical protein
VRRLIVLKLRVWGITPIVACFLVLPMGTRAQNRWTLDRDGGIAWEIKPGENHQDQIEMSGRKVSAIVTYGVRENGSLTLTRQVVFPSLRTLPNDTHASLGYVFTDDASPRLFLAGGPARETIRRIHHRGLISIYSAIGNRGELELTRTIFPSTDKPFLIEKYVFTNHGSASTTIEVENEYQARLFVAEKALELGRGGISRLSRLTGPHPALPQAVTDKRTAPVCPCSARM